MKDDALTVQRPLGSNRDPDVTIPDAEVVECAIGGYRVGVFVSNIIGTDKWEPDYLTRLPSRAPAVLGTVLYNGDAIPVVALEKLFHLEQDSPGAEPLISMVVSHDRGLLVLLLDGLLSIEPVSRAAFQSFSSLYVSGVRWLSGMFILEDRAVPMLDLKSLFEMTTAATLAYRPSVTSEDADGVTGC